MTARATRCLRCATRLDEHDDTRDPAAVPSEGDVSVCFHCGHLALFTAAGALRQPTESELVLMRRDPEVHRAMEAIRGSYTATQAVELARGDR